MGTHTTRNWVDIANAARELADAVDGPDGGVLIDDLAIERIITAREALRTLLGTVDADRTPDEPELIPRPSGYVMTLEAHRERMAALEAALVAGNRALAAEACSILDDLIRWFGAPDWLGPQLPLPLARRIDEFMTREAPGA